MVDITPLTVSNWLKLIFPFLFFPDEYPHYYVADGCLPFIGWTKIFVLIYNCNDLFSRFEQQTSILEKLAEATDPTTDRHGHDGPSQGLVSKHLENLKLGTENRLSELRNEMAGRTVTCVTDVTDSGGNWVSESCDDLQTDRRRHDGPSQVA